MKSLKYREETEGKEYELNLAPMLSMIVTLIPILLLSVMFVRITVIDSTVPQIVSKAIEKDRNNDKRKLNLALHIDDNKNIKLVATVNGAAKVYNLKPNSNEYDLKALHSTVIDYKLKHPEVFRIEVNPSENVPYVDIVKVVDEVRTKKTDDPEIHLLDEETGQKVSIKEVFPDVVFSNVVGG